MRCSYRPATSPRSSSSTLTPDSAASRAIAGAVDAGSDHD